ncbi:MAG: thiamine pyrophosphate-dependent enzyme [Salinirussus sp.]
MPADQYACTETVLETVPEAAVVANLGVASWVLADVNDRERNFYMRGGMGSTTPTGLGLARAIDEPVIVLDGDGSLLMSLGTLATVGEYGPPNLTIVVWENQSFLTTGGQPAPTADFATVAAGCGLWGETADSDEEFADIFGTAVAADEPALVAARVEQVDAGPPENYDYGHAYLTDRFRRAMMND